MWWPGQTDQSPLVFHSFLHFPHSVYLNLFPDIFPPPLQTNTLITNTICFCLSSSRSKVFKQKIAKYHDNAGLCLFFCSKHSLNIVLSVSWMSFYRQITSFSKKSLERQLFYSPGITNTSCTNRHTQSNPQEPEHQTKAAEPQQKKYVAGVPSERHADSKRCPKCQYQGCSTSSIVWHVPCPDPWRMFCILVCYDPLLASSYNPAATDLLSKPSPCSGNSQLFIEKLLLKVKAQSA